MNRIEEALQEVWRWKEEVYEEDKGKSLQEVTKTMHDCAEALCKKYGIKLRKAPLPGSKNA